MGGTSSVHAESLYKYNDLIAVYEKSRSDSLWSEIPRSTNYKFILPDMVIVDILDKRCQQESTSTFRTHFMMKGHTDRCYMQLTNVQEAKLQQLLG